MGQRVELIKVIGLWFIEIVFLVRGGGDMGGGVPPGVVAVDSIGMVYRCRRPRSRLARNRACRIDAPHTAENGAYNNPDDLSCYIA